MSGLPFNTAIVGEDYATSVVGTGVFVGVMDDNTEKFRSLTDAEIHDISSRWREDASAFMVHADLTPDMQPAPGIVAHFRAVVDREYRHETETA